MAEPTDVPITTDTIRLGQFLKLADAVDQGSDVRALLAAGDVSVNGNPETRRGAQLRDGDLVRLGGNDFRVLRSESVGDL